MKIKSFVLALIFTMIFANVTVFAVEKAIISREVSTYDELVKALASKTDIVTINKNIDINGDVITVENGTKLIINKDIVITVSSNNFIIRGNLVNNGTINVTGRICFYKEPKKMGNTIKGVNGDIGFITQKANVDTINYYINKNSVYTSLSIIVVEETTVEIDRNLDIAEGKALWLNINTILKVNKKVTLNAKGKVEVCGKAIIDGEVIGNYFVLKYE